MTTSILHNIIAPPQKFGGANVGYSMVKNNGVECFFLRLRKRQKTPQNGALNEVIPIDVQPIYKSDLV